MSSKNVASLAAVGGTRVLYLWKIDAKDVVI